MPIVHEQKLRADVAEAPHSHVSGQVQRRVTTDNEGEFLMRK
jgi:hypothetical protein